MEGTHKTCGVSFNGRKIDGVLEKRVLRELCVRHGGRGSNKRMEKIAL